MSNPNGYVIWEGKSTFTSDPIAVIATCFSNKSQNRKTGDMIQVYIIKQNQLPTEALKSADDGAICGDCKYNRSVGKGGCYVNVGQSVNGIYRAYMNGSYEKLPEDYEYLFEGRLVRFGAYGDPAAVPYEVWEPIVNILKTRKGRSYTGYTHAWKYCDPRYRNICMASVDSEEELLKAKEMGWSTFRVKYDTDLDRKDETHCPASEEKQIELARRFIAAGKPLETIKHIKCEDCCLCDGLGRKSKQNHIVINVHGAAWKKKAFLTVNGRAT